MPAKLVAADPKHVDAYGAAFAPQLVGRNCQLMDYQRKQIMPIAVDGELIAYASPDSTYAVTKSLLDAARESIRIGIYDFTARYMEDILLAAMRRGVKVTLILDLDNRTGETPVFEDLVHYGCDGVPAPSCASDHAHYFPSFHEKVIVIDDTWVLVQSGNYSENSIPENQSDGAGSGVFVPGNRDMGIAVCSRDLASFFRDLIASDMELELAPVSGKLSLGDLARLAEVELLQASPSKTPPTLFPSRRFSLEQPLQVTPVLSPDNYMQLVPDLLSTASRSIQIEQQYIRGRQTEIGKLLGAIRDAVQHNPGLDVRIVLAMPFPGKQFAREAQEIRDLQATFGLELGANIRILNPRYFVHCHNKLIIVDERKVLVGSQNWSDFAVSRNREASLLLDYAPLAQYYGGIFQLDWDTGLTSLRKPKASFFGPLALGTGKVVPLRWGDYVDV